MVKPAPVFHVFCDEAYLPQPGHTFRVQGGLWVPETSMRDVRAGWRAQRLKHPKIGEYKWEYVNGATPKVAYTDLVDLFFSLAAAGHICFKCLVIHKADDPSQRLDKAGKDLGFYKAYYTFLRWRLGLGARHHVTLDQKTSPRAAPEEQLRRCLNNAVSRIPGKYYVVSCKMVRSHAEDLVQMADVLCGAVGWSWNAMKSVANAKPLLHGHICGKLGWTTLALRTTNATAKPFNVWKYQPRKK